MRLEDISDKLYSKDDVNGYAIYFLDEKFELPFSGEIYVKCLDYIESEAQYKNGRKNGLEYIYYPNGKIEQINECRGNVTFGVSKEFEKEGNLRSVSIVYNNDYIKTISLENRVIKEVEPYNGKYGDKLPEYLQNLLKLTDQELIDYQFKTDNPYLNIEE